MNAVAKKLSIVFATVLLMSLPFLGWWRAMLLGAFGAIYLLFTERNVVSVPTPGTLLEQKRSRRVAGLFSLSDRLHSVDSRTWIILASVAAVLMPLLLNRYQTEVVTLAFIYVSLAIGLNFIVGLCGLLALGYIAFYAIGAYTYALLNTHFGVNFFICLPLGLVTGAIAGALVGLPVLRLRGDYLAIVTLGFGEIVRIVLNNWDSLTAGPNGIMGIARPTLFGIKLGTAAGYYYLAGLLAVLAMIFQARLLHSRAGRAWEAIREDEMAAAHAGVPVFKMKMLAMILGGAWAGAAGTLFAAHQTHVSPESFTFLESVLVLCMVVLGGMGSVSGAAVGALALILFPEFLRGIETYRMLAFGLLMVLMMRFRQGGFLPSSRLKVAPAIRITPAQPDLKGSP